MENSYLDLAASWREEADRLRERYASDHLAQLCEAHARELEHLANARLDEELTITHAADLSGYSKSHLRQLIRDGEIPNAGRKGRPRIRRGDLPMKRKEDRVPNRAQEDGSDWDRLGMPDPSEQARRVFDASPGTGQVN